ncbi:unnamed protein product, partial [marine sediment metagenome]
LPRGRGDQTSKDYSFTVPLVIAGEMTLESPSIKHRIIEAFFNNKKKDGKTEYFESLCDLPLGSFGKGLLQYMLGKQDEQLYQAFDEQKALVGCSMDDRFKDNAALARVGLWLIMDYCKSHDIDMDEYNEGFDYIDSAIQNTRAAARLTNVDKVISDLSIMSNERNGTGNWLILNRHYERRKDSLYIRTAETYKLYQRYAKSHDTLSEPISKSSFLQQLESKEYFVSKGTVRIGDQICNGICLDLSSMPDYMEISFAA